MQVIELDQKVEKMRLLLIAVLLLTYGGSRVRAVTDVRTEAPPATIPSTTPTLPGPIGSEFGLRVE